MTWLGEWLKEIVFVVLLAIFVELMLPSKSMQRYVKLVLSLLVLLTLLDPLLEVLNHNPLEKLQSAIETQFKPSTSDQSLERILKEGEQMRLSQEQDSQKWAAEQVASQMKQQLSAGTNLSVDKVSITLKVTRVQSKEGASQQEIDQPSISSVQVYLRPGKEKDNAVMAAKGDGGGDVDGNIPEQPKVEIKVPAVDKVQIDINAADAGITADSEEFQSRQASGLLPDLQNDGTSSSETPDETDADAQSAVAAPQTDETSKATQLLGGSWGIDPGIIHFFLINQGTKQ